MMCNFGTEESRPEKAKEIAAKSLTTMRRADNAIETGTFLHGRWRGSALVFFDERTQPIQSFVPIVRNLV
jgi:hypothetical protein